MHSKDRQTLDKLDKNKQKLKLQEKPLVCDARDYFEYQIPCFPEVDKFFRFS